MYPTIPQCPWDNIFEGGLQASQVPTSQETAQCQLLLDEAFEAGVANASAAPQTDFAPEATAEDNPYGLPSIERPAPVLVDPTAAMPQAAPPARNLVDRTNGSKVRVQMPYGTALAEYKDLAIAFVEAIARERPKAHRAKAASRLAQRMKNENRGVIIDSDREAVMRELDEFKKQTKPHRRTRTVDQQPLGGIIRCGSASAPAYQQDAVSVSSDALGPAGGACGGMFAAGAAAADPRRPLSVSAPLDGGPALPRAENELATTRLAERIAQLVEMHTADCEMYAKAKVELAEQQRLCSQAEAARAATAAQLSAQKARADDLAAREKPAEALCATIAEARDAQRKAEKDAADARSAAAAADARRADLERAAAAAAAGAERLAKAMSERLDEAARARGDADRVLEATRVELANKTRELEQVAAAAAAEHRCVRWVRRMVYVEGAARSPQSDAASTSVPSVVPDTSVERSHSRASDCEMVGDGHRPMDTTGLECFFVASSMPATPCREPEISLESDADRLRAAEAAPEPAAAAANDRDAENDDRVVEQRRAIENMFCGDD